MLERLFSNRTAYRQLQHAAQSGLQDGISNESAGLKNLDTNQFALVVEFDSDVRSDLDAAGFFLVADRKMQNVIFFKIRHSWMIHTRNLPLCRRKRICCRVVA